MRHLPLCRDPSRDFSNVTVYAFCLLVPTHAALIMKARIKELPKVTPDESLTETWNLTGDGRARLYCLLCREFKLTASDLHVVRLKRSDATVRELYQLLQTLHEQLLCTRLIRPPELPKLAYEVRRWLKNRKRFLAAEMTTGRVRIAENLGLSPTEHRQLLDDVLRELGMHSELLVRELLSTDPNLNQICRRLRRHALVICRAQLER